MKALLQIIAVLTGIIAALVFVIAGFILFYFDPNDYKNQIIAEVEKQTGRPFSLPGEISVNLLPSPGLELAGLSLGNAPGFGEPSLISTGRVLASVRLWPLLHKELQINSLLIEEANIHLAIDENGESNWRTLLPPGVAAPFGPQQQALLALAALSLSGVNLRDASLTLADRSRGERYEVRELNVTAGPITPGKPFDLSTTFKINTHPQGITGDIALTGVIAYDLRMTDFTAKPLTLAASLSGPPLPDGRVNLKLAGQLAIDRLADRAELSPFSAALSSPAGAGLVFEATGAARVTGIASEPQYRGEIQTAPANLRAWLTQLGQQPLVAADATTLTKAALSAQFSGASNHLTIDQLTLTLDESTVQGHGEVADFAAPAVGFNLTADAINLDRYLPPRPAGAQPPWPLPEALAAAAAGLPPAVLRTVRAQGELQIGRLQAANARLSNVKLSVQARDGMIRLAPVAAELYDGRYQADIILDAAGREPKLTSDSQLQRVQLAPLLTDLTGAAPWSGTGNIHAKLTATGRQPEALKSTLTGQATFALEDGRFQGVNLDYLLRQAAAFLQGQRATAPPSELVTAFSELTGTLQIRNGIIANDDLAARTEEIRASGKGTVNLVDETVDYVLYVTVAKTMLEQAGQASEAAGDYTLPVRIRGRFNALIYQPDWAGLAETGADKERDQAPQGPGAIIERRLRDRLGDQTVDKLKKMLKF